MKYSFLKCIYIIGFKLKMFRRKFIFLITNVMFQETTSPLLRKLYDTRVKPYDEDKAFTDASSGIERIRTEFHGFMVSERNRIFRIEKKNNEVLLFSGRKDVGLPNHQ